MKLKLFIGMLFFTVLNTSCDDNSKIPESSEFINIAVKQGEIMDYDTSIDAVFGSFEVIDSTKNHSISKLYLASNGYNLYHKYQSLDNYLGNDTLKISKQTIDDTNDEIISIRNITIVLTVE